MLRVTTSRFGMDTCHSERSEESLTPKLIVKLRMTKTNDIPQPIISKQIPTHCIHNSTLIKAYKLIYQQLH